jgi:hypothetical protein
MIVEYDGPLHQSSTKQQERDEIKNELCRLAVIGLLRINDRYVTQLYRGMSVLRWIVVAELEKAFYEAQEKGHIPRDEPFDPAFLEPVGSGRRFPYWLSASATQSFHAFFETLDRDIPKGWNGIIRRSLESRRRVEAEITTRRAFRYSDHSTFGLRLLHAPKGHTLRHQRPLWKLCSIS